MSSTPSLNSSARWPLALCMAALSAVATWSAQRAVAVWGALPAGAGSLDAQALVALQALLSFLALGLCAWRWWRAPCEGPPGALAVEAGSTASARLRTVGALMVFSLLSISLLPGALAQSTGLAWLLALMLLGVGLWATPADRTFSVRPLYITGALLLPQSLIVVALLSVGMSKELRSVAGGWWVLWAPLVSALLSAALLSHWADKKRPLKLRRLRLAVAAFMLTASALTTAWWLGGIAVGQQLLPSRDTLKALEKLVDWAMRSSPAEVWGTVLLVLLTPALVTFWRARPERPSASPSRFSWALTTMLVGVMAVGAYASQGAPGSAAWAARLGLSSAFLAPSYGGAWGASSRSGADRCPTDVLTAPLTKRMEPGSLLLVHPETPRDSGAASALVGMLQSSAAVRVAQAKEPGLPLPNGWLVQPPEGARAWTLVIGQVPEAKQDEPRTSHQPTMRAALFDETGLEVGRWQAKGGYSAMAGDAAYGCPASKKETAPSLRGYLQLPQSKTGAWSSSLWTNNISAEVSLAPVSPKDAQAPYEPSPVLTHACQAQAAVDSSVKPSQGRTKVTLTGPEGQKVSLLQQALGGFAQRNGPTLMHCTAEGVWVVRKDAAAFVRWSGDLAAQARYATPALGDARTEVTIRVREDGAYLLAAKGAEAGYVIKFPRVPSSTAQKAAQPVSALQAAIERGDVKLLSREEVAAIQAQFVASHSWFERMSDWFRARDKQRIKTDVPHAMQSYLVLKPLDQLPSSGAKDSYIRPVFYIDKGVPAPKQLNVIARVMDMNTWTCIADSFWCPWPKGATAR